MNKNKFLTVAITLIVVIIASVLLFVNNESNITSTSKSPDAITTTQSVTTKSATTTQKQTTTKETNTTQRTTVPVTKKETTTQKKVTTTKKAETTTKKVTTTVKNITPQQICNEVNAYIKNMGYTVDTSYRPDNSSWDGRVSDVQAYVNDGTSKKTLIGYFELVINEIDERTKFYCYHDGSNFYLLYK